MTTEEIDKLYNDGEISIKEADELRNKFRSGGTSSTSNKNLNEKELYKLFDKGDIDAREFDELRKALPSYQQDKINVMLLRKKKSEIVALYKKGELSISDTIAYENNLLLDRNRKNTSTIVTIIAINIILVILGVMSIVF
jgi:hypothetical protein